MAEAVGPEAFLRQQTAIMARPDRRREITRYAVPTLVMCGRQDALTPLAPHEEMVAVAIPGARLAIISECGHLATMERSYAATALLATGWFTAADRRVSNCCRCRSSRRGAGCGAETAPG